MKRVMATRAASIWRSVIQPQRMAFSPKSPKASSEPRQALPFMRPRCCFLYLTFFGINMALFLLRLGLRRRGRRPSSGLRRRGLGGASAAGGGSCFNSCFQAGCGGASGGVMGPAVRAG